MTNRALKGVSAFALLFGLSGAAAFAQQTGQPPADTVEQIRPAETRAEQATDRIIVTGTNIAGAAESAALPVDVYTAEDSLQQGNQTPLEFVKSLSVVGSTTGETNQFQGFGSIGQTTLNLRGLGGGRTLTIFNGRRFTEDTSLIPSIALSRTEILKDGGAVIYGADATGGVVNFITRDNFDGLIIDGEYKRIEDSEGDWNAGVLWGKNFDNGNGNLLLSAEWNHRSELDMIDRDWAPRSYAENPTQYNPYHNYSTYSINVPEFVRPLLGLSQLPDPFSAGAVGFVRDFDNAQCESSSGPVQAVVGIEGGVLPVCRWNFPIHTYNLVEEMDQQKYYAQWKHDISDTLRFTGQLSYGQTDLENIGTVAAYSALVGPGPNDGPAFQFRIPEAHPRFDAFIGRTTPQLIGLAQALLGVNQATATAIVNNNILPNVSSADIFLGLFFGPSGAPHIPGGEGVGVKVQRENWNGVAALEGDFDGAAGEWLDTWSTSVTFNRSTDFANQPDYVTYRIQEALNGFGGPNCRAADLVPDNFSAAVLDTNGDGEVTSDEFYAVIGTQNPGAAGQNGCMWLNPFSDSYAGNATFGQPNPLYVPGAENSAELAAWLYDEAGQVDIGQQVILDALVSGGTPIELAGGQIAWAAGAQWRQSKNKEHTNSPFLDPRRFPCPWPGQQVGDVGCPAEQPAYAFFGTDEQNNTSQEQYSYFAEFQIPVLDNLSFQAAVRREEFPDIDLGATVYKLAGKWDPFRWLAVRGSFGTNYATPPSNFQPGDTTFGLSLIAAAGDEYLRVGTETLANIEPETAEVANFGLIFNFDQGMPANGALRMSFDYFNFSIQDEIKTVSHNAILNKVFLAGQPTNGSGLIDCNAALIERITFTAGVGSGGCTQNVTTGGDVASILSVRGNGPGVETSGLDVDVNYEFDLMGGVMTANLNATNILSYEIQAYELNGVELSPFIDGLGFANYSRDGDLVSEWRGNATLNYNNGNHNLRYVYRYVQGVEDDRRAVGDPYRQIDDWITSNLYYQYTMPWDENFTVSFSVENVFDEDPPFTQQQYSYDPFIGNPLGRTFEIGIRKQF